MPLVAVVQVVAEGADDGADDRDEAERAEDLLPEQHGQRNRGVRREAVPLRMVAVGEETGALDVMLNKIADFYDEEVTSAVEGITSLIEPLMMVLLGGIVGGMVVALYMPMFNLVALVQ